MLCSYCAEEIKDDAKKCRYCGEWLTPKEEIKDSLHSIHLIVSKSLTLLSS